MEQKVDLRIVKTYRALTESLKSLLLEKPLSEITVSEICDRAMVRRATFYKHFGDKYELLTFIFMEMQDDIRQSRSAAYPSSDNKNGAYYYDIVSLIEYVDKNEALFRALNHNCSTLTICQLVGDHLAYALKEYLMQNSNGNRIHSASFELTCQLLAGSLIYGISWWLEHRERFTKEEMIEQLNNFFIRAACSAF